LCLVLRQRRNHRFGDRRNDYGWWCLGHRRKSAMAGGALATGGISATGGASAAGGSATTGGAISTGGSAAVGQPERLQ